MKIGFVSLGCAKNLVDSEELMGRVKSLGFTLVSKAKEAEVIVINTCGFIQSAKEESISTILEMADYKNDQLKYLIVCGCLSQRYKKDLIEAIPEVDCFITIDEYPDFEKILCEVTGVKDEIIDDASRIITTKPWTAYLKIGEGCDNCCTYCAIPLIRGKYRSIPMDEVLENARYLASKGVKELCVIAQDTSCYGIDFGDNKPHLLDLLKELNKIDGFHWIRVLYMYPDEIDMDLILGMKQLEKVVPYFDIPTQHFSNRLLKKMNRRGTVETIQWLCETIRANFEVSTLRTTLIVGFPGESEKDFATLTKYVEELKWDRLGAFKYSREEDTKAYDMTQSVSEKKKQERLDVVMSMQQPISQANSEKRIGKKLEVLIESYNAIKEEYRGRSQLSAPDDVDGYVYITSDRDLQFGEFYEAEITDASIYDLYGVVK